MRNQVAHYMEVQKLLDNVYLSGEQTVWATVNLKCCEEKSTNGANVFNIN